MTTRFLATPLLFFLFFTFLCASEHSELLPDFTVMIKMQDGVELPTDLYFPEKENEPLPCILLRCPAGRKAYPWRNYAKLAHFGYVVAIQDTRSAIDHEGKTIPYVADGWGENKDGYEAVEWLAKSGLTDGNIGTIGFSAGGITQQMLAPTAPPSLKCQYIGVAAGSLYHHAVFPGGQLLKDQVEGWLQLYAKHPSVYQFLCNQPHYNDFWKGLDAISMAHEVSVPAVHYSGWYDTFIQGTLDSFVARQTKGKEGALGKQKLVIGPWTHYFPESVKLGDFQVPLNAHHMPESFAPERWFAHYLKQVDHQVEKLPAVTYYLMGPFDGSDKGNEWKSADVWPVPSKEVHFYLTPDQCLSPFLPQVNQATFSYLHDPQNPIPTIGGRNLFIESGPKDQREIEKREDVLVFTSQPLDKDLEITGRITATLFFTSEESDTDVTIRFCDVYPDGRSILIADSLFRTGLLHHHPEEAILHDPKMPFEFSLDLWSTSVLIPKGHRLRVCVTSSNYPKFEKNSGKSFKDIKMGAFSIKNTLFTGKKSPSRITLPVVD